MSSTERNARGHKGWLPSALLELPLGFSNSRPQMLSARQPSRRSCHLPATQGKGLRTSLRAARGQQRPLGATSQPGSPGSALCVGGGGEQREATCSQPFMECLSHSCGEASGPCPLLLHTSPEWLLPLHWLLPLAPMIFHLRSVFPKGCLLTTLLKPAPDLSSLFLPRSN